MKLAIDSTTYESIFQGWLDADGKAIDTLSKGKSAYGTVELVPNLENVTSTTTEHQIIFKLLSDEQLLSVQRVPVKIEELKITPEILNKGKRLSESRQFLSKGRPFSIDINIPKKNERCIDIPITVKILAEPDFKINYPATNELRIITGSGRISIRLTPLFEDM